jgi:catechol 2,3-dioxygenase-like lactoylglutathione lyase family enzyme
MIKGLHHNAYRCRDSEETRVFYEDFLGLRFVSAFEIEPAATGHDTRALHTFFEMDDGSCLAFFEVPGLHIALGVEGETFESMFAEGEGGRPRGARARRPRLCSLDLFPRSQWLRHRIDCQHREAWRNDGPCHIEAA